MLENVSINTSHDAEVSATKVYTHRHLFIYLFIYYFHNKELHKHYIIQRCGEGTSENHKACTRRPPRYNNIKQ